MWFMDITTSTDLTSKSGIPMPTGVGGLSTAVPYANFNAWHAKVVIRF